MRPIWQENSMVRNILAGNQIVGINMKTNDSESVKIHTNEPLPAVWNILASVIFGYAPYIPYFTDRHNSHPIGISSKHKPEDPFKEGCKIIWHTKPLEEATSIMIHGK